MMLIIKLIKSSFPLGAGKTFTHQDQENHIVPVPVCHTEDQSPNMDNRDKYTMYCTYCKQANQTRMLVDWERYRLCH